MPFLLPPGTSRIVDGLRDTGYTILTSIADIVDNSIAAQATKVNILFQTDDDRNIRLFIADDGCGMDFEGLKNAMTYGSLEREDPHSLGKFGLGLKTASTAFCKSLSVISRTDETENCKLQWDLDHIAEVNRWEVLQPEILEDEEEFLDEVAGEDSHGTLVVWEKVDRILNKSYKSISGYRTAFDRLSDKIAKHLSLVFQRFIDTNYEDAPNVEITFNGVVLTPTDPFCLRELRRLDDGTIDRNGTILVVNNKPELLDDNDNVLSTAVFKAWIIPNKYNYSSEESRDKANISNHNQGFYIYRENRLIYYGTWLGLYSVEPHMSLLRVDLSFDSSFDEYLNVDIKKSHVILNEELAEEFKRWLGNPRTVANDRYRKPTNKKTGLTSSDNHQPSNMNIKNVEGQIPGSSPILTPTATGEVNVKPQNGEPEFVTSTIKIRVATNNTATRIIPIQSIDGGFLWEPSTTGDGHTAVSINQGHSYYQKIYEPNIGNPNLVMGMDYLLWALSLAEVRLCNPENKELFEELRNEVSRILKTTLKTIPDQDN